jgi:hypothetical protein
MELGTEGLFGGDCAAYAVSRGCEVGGWVRLVVEMVVVDVVVEVVIIIGDDYGGGYYGVEEVVVDVEVVVCMVWR